MQCGEAGAENDVNIVEMGRRVNHHLLLVLVCPVVRIPSSPQPGLPDACHTTVEKRELYYADITRRRPRAPLYTNIIQKTKKMLKIYTAHWYANIRCILHIILKYFKDFQQARDVHHPLMICRSHIFKAKTIFITTKQVQTGHVIELFYCLWVKMLLSLLIWFLAYNWWKITEGT